MSRTRRTKIRDRRHHAKYEPILAILLGEDPLKRENLERKYRLFVSQFESFGYHFMLEVAKENSGFLARFGRRFPEKDARRRMRYDESNQLDFGIACQNLIDRHLLQVNGEGDYELTEMGKREAKESSQRLENATQTLEKNFLSVTAAARNTILTTSLLTVIKLSAGLLSGSVGLTADGVDSAVDTVSATVVWLGIRIRRELLSNFVTVIMMFVAAVSIGYESAAKIWAIATGTISPMSLPLVVIGIEATTLTLSFFLSLYQRIVGRTRGSLTLISQSVDSKNHVYVAASVILGAILSMVGVTFVDALVGTFVAGRILLDASGLLKDALSQAKGKAVDLSKYQVPLERPYRAGREETLKTWILYLMKEDGAATKEEIVESLEEISKLGKEIPFVNEIGLSQGATSDLREFDALITTMIKDGLVRKDGERFLPTPAGKSRVDKVFRSLRYHEQAQSVIQRGN